MMRLRPTLISLCSCLLLTSMAFAADPIKIGTNRELFVDDHVVDKLIGSAELRQNLPSPEEVVLHTDKPWEGNTCAYYTIFQDGDIYRMYYRGSHANEKMKGTHREVTCYAESRDGIQWTKPSLRLFEFNGSKDNNIVWDGIGTHCFAPFKDTNPDCPPEAKYKAVSRGRPVGKKGLYTFQSKDGIHWKQVSQEPVITDGAFDSQNLTFWDSNRKLYVAYYRNFRNGIRDIMMTTSKDFVNWEKPVFLTYPGARPEHLYTNAIQQYDRAPQIYVGFPTRYLPSEASRVEPVFMTSRDGKKFLRWPEALIPEDAPKDRDGNRSNYMTRGLLELPGDKENLSLYATEAYYTGPDSRVRRFTIRKDGFVSVHAGARTGEVVTKPLTFTGKELEVNYRSLRGGVVRVELQEPSGVPITGYSTAAAERLEGSSTGRVIKWNGEKDLSKLVGKPVRLRFVMKNSDIYSFRFKPVK